MVRRVESAVSRWSGRPLAIRGRLLGWARLGWARSGLMWLDWCWAGLVAPCRASWSLVVGFWLPELPRPGWAGLAPAELGRSRAGLGWSGAGAGRVGLGWAWPWDRGWAALCGWVRAGSCRVGFRVGLVWAGRWIGLGWAGSAGSCRTNCARRRMIAVLKSERVPLVGASGGSGGGRVTGVCPACCPTPNPYSPVPLSLARRASQIKLAVVLAI